MNRLVAMAAFRYSTTLDFRKLFKATHHFTSVVMGLKSPGCKDQEVWPSAFVHTVFPVLWSEICSQTWNISLHYHLCILVSTVKHELATGIKTMKKYLHICCFNRDLFLSIHYKIAIKNLFFKFIYLHINKRLCKFYKILARKHNNCLFDT